MMVAERVARPIQRVPCLLIGLLADAGKLARPPEPSRDALGFRLPGLDEVSALTWLVQWEGEKIDASGLRTPVGAVSYYDHYDFHLASDVREIVFITGSRRACYELFAFVRDEARSLGRRAIGNVPVGNSGEIAMLEKMGGKQTRVMIEDEGASLVA